MSQVVIDRDSEDCGNVSYKLQANPVSRVAVPGERVQERMSWSEMLGLSWGESYPEALSYFKMLRTAGKGVKVFLCK